RKSLLKSSLLLCLISFHPLLLVQHLFYIVVAKTGCKSEAVLTSSGERRAVILSSLENRESDKSSRGVRLVPGSQTDFRVSLNNISPGDSGTYCCSLEGTSADVFMLPFSAHPSQPLLRGPSDSITVGSQISFRCSAKEFPSQEITVIWLKDSNEIQAARTDILNYTMEEGIRYCVESTVDILLRPEDMGSVLSCRRQHSRLAGPLLLIKLFGFLCSVPPTVRLETDPLSPIQLNTSVTVTCNAEYFYPNVAKVDLFCKNPSGKGKSARATLNANGTYSRQSSLEIIATENWNASLFTCLVKHNSTVFKATRRLFIKTELGEGKWGGEVEEETILAELLAFLIKGIF
uniref:Ig-like domain-containing protein n=1 Tax=Pseudonaja textilis TaxID=8673 RepID=A0A670ZFB5_PSETE